MKHTIEELRQWQALPLSIKVRMTQERIRMWVREYGESGVYLSFSGGKDSTVLSHIIDRTYPGNEIPRVFVNTGLEYPEIVSFVKQEPRAVMLRPKMNFRQVIDKYGYPMFSKENSLFIHQLQQPPTEKNKKTRNLRLNGIRSDGVKISIGKLPKMLHFMVNAPFKVSNRCCDVMKKEPLHRYSHEQERFPMTAEMAEESRVRKQKWLENGCNGFHLKEPKSTPMAFWTEQDVLRYIKEFNVPIASVYGEIVTDYTGDNFDGQLEFTEDGIKECECLYKTTGCDRTGCMFCGYGCHLEDGVGRYVQMKETHPKIYEWVFKDWERGGLGYKKMIDWINENGNMHIRY